MLSKPLLSAAVVILTAACAAAPPRSGAAPAADACAVGSAGTAPDILVIGLSDSVSPADAPLPRNDSERLVFRQLYRGLFRRDCTGTLLPDLARSWTEESGKIRVSLRAATFSDGTPVTATAVIAAWRSNAARLGETLGIDVSAPNDSTLIVAGSRGLTGSGTVGGVPFEDPLLAVTGATTPSGWPAASGPYAPPTDAAPRRLTPRGAGPVLLLRERPRGDPRDLLDGGADLLITRDPQAVGYAAERSDLTPVPLPWDRVYLLILSGTASALPAPDSAVRLRLAGEAVREEARPAESTGWWNRLTCSAGGPPPGVTSGRLLVAANDPTARLLAQRVAVLAADRPEWLGPLTGRPTVQPISPESLSSVRAAGYLLALPASMPASCAEVPRLPAGAVQPLIQTRPRAIVRAGRVAFTADADATVRILPGGTP